MFTIITYYVRIGDLAMLIGLAGLLVLRKPIRITPHLLLFGIYIIWAAGGLSSTRYPEILQERIVDYAKLWLIVLVTVNALRTRAQIQIYLILVTVWYLLFPSRGTIVNYIAGWSPAGRAVWNHIYANTNDLAALTLLALSMAAAVFLSEGDRRIRIGALASAIVFGCVVLMTQSRGAVVALMVFAFLAVGGQRRKLRSVLFLAVCGAVIISLAPSDVWQRVKGLALVTDLERLERVDAEQSAEQRFEIWKVAARIISDHPVQGVGLGAYPEVHAEYASSLGASVALGKRDTHSTYLNLAAETGYVGLSIFLAMFGIVFVQAERARRRIRHTALADANRLWFLEIGLATYLIAGIFGSFPQLAFLHVFMATVVAATYATVPDSAGPGVKRGRVMRGLGVPNTLPGRAR